MNEELRLVETKRPGLADLAVKVRDMRNAQRDYQKEVNLGSIEAFSVGILSVKCDLECEVDQMLAELDRRN